MTPERWRRITNIFHDARALDQTRRASFLDETCGADPSLRAEVDALLAADRHADRLDGACPILIDDPAGDGGASASSSADDVDEPEPVPAPPRHPFVVVAWVGAAASAVVFLYAAWLLAFGPAPAATGWTEERHADGWHVTSVDASGAAAGLLEPGDRILAFNGIRPPRNAGTRFQRVALSAGDPYRLSIDRRGRQRDLGLQAAADPRAGVDRLTYFFIGLVWCAVGVFVGLARPERALARFAFTGAVATGVLYLNGGVIRAGPLWAPLHIAVGYQFFARFPMDRRPDGPRRWVAVLLYAFALPAALLGLWLTMTRLAQGADAAAALLSRHTILFPVFRGTLTWTTYCGGFFAMALVAGYNYSRLTDEDARRRIRWVAFSAVIALLPQLWSAALAAFWSWFGPTGLPGFDFPVDILSVAIPLSVAYAVVRHRVFDITVVLRQSLQYLLARRALQAAVAVPIAMSAYTIFVHRDQTIAQLTSLSMGYLYWTAAAALMLRFRRPVQSWLDRRFFREQYDREQILMGLANQLANVESIAELTQLVSAELHSALHPKLVLIWDRESGSSFAVSAELASWLAAHGAPAEVPLPADARLSRGERRRLAELGASLLVPITDTADRLVGILMLGEKKSESPYTAGDKRMLQAIAKQATVVRENLRLRAQVDEEQRIRRDVLEKLDGLNVNLLKECPACGACYDSGCETCEVDGAHLTLSLPVARIVDRRYRLDRLIGKGGMAAVYEARDLRLDRRVAVKIMLGRAFGRPSLLRRFGREARAAARLSHPNIVRVYDFGTLDGGGAYLVMERLDGVTLRAELERLTILPPAVALIWFDQMLSGLAQAHDHGIVHRDLKPENVMAQDETSGRVVKILDFGLAKGRADDAHLTGTLTIEGAIMGTSGYMSPEQILGREADQRSDVFSVGVIIAEALVGHRPFDGETYADVARAVLEGDFRLPDTSPGVRDVEAILRKCLAKDPADRFVSASAVRSVLIPALRVCPPLAADEQV